MSIIRELKIFQLDFDSKQISVDNESRAPSTTCKILLP